MIWGADNLTARVGQRVLPKWVALMSFIRSTGVVRGDGVRVRVTPNGTHVWADKDFKSWPSPFKVSISQTSATVRSGLINTLSPAIDGVRISGIGDDGEVVSVPPLEIVGATDGRTYVGIHIRLTASDGDGGLGLDPVDPENLAIVEREEVDGKMSEGGVPDDEGTAFYPLAVAYWKDSKLVRSFQIVHHNLNHRYIEAAPRDGRPARHLFSAA